MTVNGQNKSKVGIGIAFIPGFSEAYANTLSYKIAYVKDELKKVIILRDKVHKIFALTTIATIAAAMESDESVLFKYSATLGWMGTIILATKLCHATNHLLKGIAHER